MVGTTADYVREPTGLIEVVFCLFSADALEAFEIAMKGIQEP